MSCLCRCDESPTVGKSFVHGHDGILVQKLVNAMGGYEPLRNLVEVYLRRPVNDNDLKTRRH